jgi:hypothetical protein
MKQDLAWFNEKIREMYGSQRSLAPRFKGADGKPVDQSLLSRVLSGERKMQLHELKQFGKLFGDPVEVLIRAGLITPADVEAWLKKRKR